MHCRPIVYKHFAERFVERYGDRKLIPKIMRAVQDKYCEHVFDCIVYGDHQRILVDKVYVTMVFDPRRQKLVLTTCY